MLFKYFYLLNLEYYSFFSCTETNKLTLLCVLSILTAPILSVILSGNYYNYTTSNAYTCIITCYVLYIYYYTPECTDAGGAIHHDTANSCERPQTMSSHTEF